MEKNIENDNDEKINKNLLIFDKGFNDIQELSSKKKLEQNFKKRKPINWYTFYKVLFKNILNSKLLIPKEELKLRLNIIKQNLPSYYNVPNSSENSNSNSLLKKFSYHVYQKNNFLKKLLDKSNKRGSLLLFDEGENKENELKDSKPQVFTRKIRKTKTLKMASTNLNLFNFGSRRSSIGRLNPFESKDLKVIQEFSPKRNSKLFENSSKAEPNSVEKRERRKYNKRSTIKMDMPVINKLFSQARKKQKSNIYFFELERKAKLKLDKQSEFNELDNINKDYLIRTPNDNEYSLVLTDKRNMNKYGTYFMEVLNKLNMETKDEKIFSYKKELNRQLLSFNDLCYDAKLEDFGQDKNFNEIKSQCDFFINKFTMDKQEEKIISDLDKFL